MRCMHLDESGRQCPMEAMEETTFCPDHTKFLDPENDPDRRTPFIYRLVALTLLLIFLYNYYQVILSGWLE